MTSFFRWQFYDIVWVLFGCGFGNWQFPSVSYTVFLSLTQIFRVISTVFFLNWENNEVWLCFAWPLPALLFWFFEYCARRRRVTADGSDSGDRSMDPEEALLSPRPQQVERGFNRLHPGRFRVMLASLEHSIPHLGCKAQAGGLGKVMNLVARHHPTDILMIHPKLKDLTYRRLTAEICIWHFLCNIPLSFVAIDMCVEIVI